MTAFKLNGKAKKIMKARILLYVLGGLSLYTGWACAQEPEQTLNFEQAWALVQSNNQSLKSEALSVEASEWVLKARKRLYWPSVSLNANYVRLENAVKTPRPTSSNPRVAGVLATVALPPYLLEEEIMQTSIRATLPLYTGGRTTAAQILSRGQLDEQKAKLKIRQDELFQILSERYFGLVLMKEVLNTRIASENGLKKHYEHASKLERHGQIAKVETLQAKTAYDRAVIDRKKSEQDVELAQLALMDLLNHTSSVIPEDTLFVGHELPNLADIIEQTKKYYPAFDVLSAKRNQAQAQAKLAKGARLPSVALFGNYTLQSEGITKGDDAPDWFIGVGVSIPIIDSSGAGYNTRSANTKMAEVNSRYQQAEQDITLLVKKTHKEAEQALDEFNGLASSEELAKETLSLRKKAFGQGLSSSLDVVDAEIFLSSIKTQRSAAAYQYVTSLTHLLALSGKMDEFSKFQVKAGSSHDEE